MLYKKQSNTSLWKTESVKLADSCFPSIRALQFLRISSYVRGYPLCKISPMHFIGGIFPIWNGKCMLLLTFRQCLMQPDTYPTKLETKTIPRIAEEASVRYKGLFVAQTSPAKHWDHQRVFKFQELLLDWHHSLSKKCLQVHLHSDSMQPYIPAAVLTACKAQTGSTSLCF